jgi:WD40 repeat protein
MTNKNTKILICTIVFLITLTSCSLPVVTPPITEVSVTPPPYIETPPILSSDTPAPTIIPNTITSSNASTLQITDKAAVSNVQQIVWSKDSTLLNLSSQTADSSGNALFGVTSLTSPKLSTHAVFGNSTGRIADLAADGRTIAVISQDEMTLTLVDLGANNNVIQTIVPGFRIGQATFSPDFTTLAITQAESWEVVLYSVTTGAELKKLNGFETAAPVFNAGYAGSPQWIAWHARGTIQLQEVESGTMGATFSHEDFISTYTLSPDGTILASAAGKTINNVFSPTVTLWDATQGLELKNLVLSAPTTTISFSPDGKLLAVGTGKNIEIWNATTGVLVTTLTGHQDQVNVVAFSSDGKSLASTGADNQLYLWQTSQ